MVKIFYFTFILLISSQKRSNSLEEALQNPKSIEYLDLISKNLTELPKSSINESMIILFVTPLLLEIR